MKVIIAGSRTIKSLVMVQQAVAESKFVIEEVVSGCAQGVDMLGECWADENNLGIVHFPANWDKYGNSAGPRRNEQMAAYADALVAVWDGASSGTKHMIDTMKKLNKKVFVKIVK